MVALQLRTLSTDRFDFLPLPWEEALLDWPEDDTVRLPRGTHRHPVKFLELSGHYVAFKELPERLARLEYELLSHLFDEGLPVVEPLGVATARQSASGEPLEGIIVTRHLSYSLPYRSLFLNDAVPDLRHRLIDALAVLLVRIHLAGFFWGDCSLNNALFRRDAGALMAYVVDVETGELHDELTDGQRRLELDVARENIAGGILDLMASGRPGTETLDPIEIVEELDTRYADLWEAVTGEVEVSATELWRIQQRQELINELGFDTAEITITTTDDGRRVRFRPDVVEEGHHKRELERLTGITAQENQARRLLNAMRGYGAWLAEAEGRHLPDAVVAYRWLAERYEPTIAAIPADLAARLEDPELYHQVLEHNWYLSEQAGREVTLPEAVESYTDQVLSQQPDERVVIDAPTEILDLMAIEDALGDEASG